MADHDSRDVEDTKRAAEAAAKAVLAKHPCVVAGAATPQAGEGQKPAPFRVAAGHQPLKV